MFKFGTASRKKLDTCHPELVLVAERALELSPYDFTIVHGWRGEDVQNALFDRNASQKRYPDSKHNKTHNTAPCSEAIDFAPYINGKIHWNDTDIFCIIVGVFLAASKDLEVRLRTGVDWDGDGLSKGDQTFMDYGHVEILL